MQDTMTIDKPYVEKRILDWKKRISDIYSTIEFWIKDSEYSFKIGPKLTMYEELMYQYKVPKTEIDTADIYKDKKIILTLKPKGLWIIGINGQINILSFKQGYDIVDTAEQFETPKWKLYNGNKKNIVDFNKEVFLQLLK